MNSCRYFTEQEITIAMQALNVTKNVAKAILTSMHNEMNGEDFNVTKDNIKNYIQGKKISEKDEVFLNNKKEAKIASLKNEQKRIIDIKNNKNNNNKLTNSQVNVLSKIIDIQEKLLEHFEEGTYAISVSNLKGVSKFRQSGEEVDIYADFKNFGIFMHYIMEQLALFQIDNSLAQQMGITKPIEGNIDVRWLDQEIFNILYDKFQEDETTAFEIENFTKETMFKAVSDMLYTVSDLINKGYVLLPEVTLGAKAFRDGDNIVVGRVDMLAIAPNGRISIIDFKTKKVQHMLAANSNDPNHVDVRVELGLNNYEIDSTGDTYSGFVGKKRTTYDEWFVQLEMYSNMLRQAGLDVDITNNKIIALAYQTTDDMSFRGQVVLSFSGYDYYISTQDYIKGARKFSHATSKWLGSKEDAKIRQSNKLDPLMKMIDEAIPYKDVVQEERMSKEELYNISPTEDKMQKFLTVVYENSKKNLEVLEAQLNEHGISDEVKNLRKTQISYLRSIINVIENGSRDEQLPFYRGLLYAQTLEQVEEQIYNLTKKFNEINKIYNEAIQNYMNNPTKENKQKYLDQYKIMMEIHEENNAVSEILNMLYEIGVEAKNNPANNITEDSVMYKKLLGAYAQHNSLQNKWQDATITMLTEVLRTISEADFVNITKGIRDVFTVEKSKILKKIDKLENNRKSIFNKIQSGFFKTLKRFINQEKDIYEDANLTEIEKEITGLRKRLHEIDAILNGLNYDRESLQKIIDNMKDPNSILYLGARTLYNKNWTMSNGAFARFQATVTDQDLGIASVVIMLKNAEGMMNHNITNDKALHDLAKNTDSIKNKKNIGEKELNEKIAEWTTIKRYNKETKQIEDRRVFVLVKPTSNEFETTYQTYNYKFRILKEKEKELRYEYNKIIKEQPKNHDAIKEAENAYFEAKKETYRHNAEYIDWLVKYANLPYIDAYYQLQKGLPLEYQEQLDDIYLTISTIMSRDIAEQDDDDYDTLFMLRAQIKEIKQKAQKENPEYAKIIEQMEGMYDADYNEEAYERALRNAEIKFKNHPDLLAKWKKTYQIEKYSQEWYDRRNAIYDRLGEIFGKDDVLDALYARRNEIKARYKQNYVYNPIFYTTDEINELDEIDKEIADYIENKPKYSFSIEERQEIKDLKNELASIQESILSPFYVERFNERTDIMIARRNAMNAAASILENKQKRFKDKNSTITEEELMMAEMKYIQAENDFANVWSEYRDYYNKYHEDKLGEFDYLRFNRDRAIPKSFNYIYRPISQKYIQIVGNPNYFTKYNIKDEARNPNYVEGVENMPLPKGVISIGDGVYDLTPEGMMNPYVNQKFKDIVADKDYKDYYDKLTTYYFGLQKKMIGKKMGYEVPGYAEDKMENFSRYGFFKGLSREIAKKIDKHMKFEGSQQDYVENVFGDLGVIRSRFTRQLTEDIQTTDAINAIYKFAVEAHYNSSMQEVQPQTEGAIEYFKQMIRDLETTQSANPAMQKEIEKRIKEWRYAVEVLEFEKRKYIQGQIDDSQQRKLKKVVNLLFQHVSLMRLGFDVTNQLKNFSAASVQMWLQAGGGSNHYSQKNMMTAYRKVYGINGVISNYLKDWGKIHDLHESTMLYRMMNPLQKDMIKYYKQITGGRLRRMGDRLTDFMELGYMVQDKGDTMIGMLVMHAVMDSYKYKKIDPITKQPVLEDGKPVLIPASECYIQKPDGTLEIRNDVEYTIEDQLKLRRIIVAELRRAQGNYATSDMTRIEASTIGKLMLFYRKYLVPLMLNRFGILRPSWETGEATLGYWRALAQAYGAFGAKATLKQFLLGNFTNKFEDGVSKLTYIDNAKNGKQEIYELGDIYARKINHASRDALAMIILLSLSMMALGALRRRDDDDEPVDIITGNLIRILWGTTGEATSVFPFGAGTDEYIRNFSTALPMARELSKAYQTVDRLFKTAFVMIAGQGEEPDPDIDANWYVEWYKDVFYTSSSSGYPEGTMKLKKDLHDLTGYSNIRGLLQPEVRLKNMASRF